jgi:hypothetical protein
VRLFLSAVITIYAIILGIIDSECKEYNKDIMAKPPSKPTTPKVKPMTAKRKKILERAMLQLKKTRAQMDPSVLGKIRSIIASNPKVMKSLGLDKMPEEGNMPAKKKTHKEALEKALINSGVMKGGAKKTVIPAHEEPQAKSTEEKIDQVHNQEVIAKLMQLKPSEVENIKKVLLKGKV